MFNIVLANIALALTIILWVLSSLLFKSVHGWFAELSFFGDALILFAVLRLTLDNQTFKLNKVVHFIFGIANILSIAGFALFFIGTHEGANALGAALFVGIYFYVPALALYLCGIIGLAVYLSRKVIPSQSKPS
ncbi:hypothetical protein JCM14076_12650 [Methylosoma difficile]